MITREAIKAEIDKVQDRYLEILYKVIKAFTASPDRVQEISPVSYEVPAKVEPDSWAKFIEDTYGSLADDPIERGEQGQYEVREEFSS